MRLSSRFFIWLFLMSLFIGNQIIEHLGVKIKLLYSYFDDLLFFPIMLTSALFIERFRTDNYKYVFPISWIVFAYIFFSFIVEFIYPIISKDFTFDPIDLLSYSVGVLVFIFIFNKPAYHKQCASIIKTD